MLKAMKKKLKDQRGLTLIELLAVIVILGIIAAIAVPSIGGIINKTRDDAKVAEGLQIVNAAKLYVAATSPATGTELTKTQLADYLDNINNDTYKVTLTKNATTGKYTYSLTLHNSVSLVDGKDGTTKDSAAAEAELLKY